MLQINLDGDKVSELHNLIVSLGDLFMSFKVTGVVIILCTQGDVGYSTIGNGTKSFKMVIHVFFPKTTKSVFTPCCFERSSTLSAHNLSFSL